MGGFACRLTPAQVQGLDKRGKVVFKRTTDRYSILLTAKRKETSYSAYIYIYK